MAKSPDNLYFKKSLFQPENPKLGEEGYLAPGYHRNAEGKIFDDEGNEYDENGNIIKEALFPEYKRGLEIARAEHPDWPDKELKPLADIYARKVRQENIAKNNKRGTKKK